MAWGVAGISGFVWGITGYRRRGAARTAPSQSEIQEIQRLLDRTPSTGAHIHSDAAGQTFGQRQQPHAAVHGPQPQLPAAPAANAVRVCFELQIMSAKFAIRDESCEDVALIQVRGDLLI